MTDIDPIREYVIELAQRLPAFGTSSRRVLSEVEDHLRQRADKLQATGGDRREAERAAIARFGTVQQIARQFELQPPLPSEEDVMIRSALTVLAAITSLYAVLLMGLALVNEPAAVFTYVKVAIAAIVVGSGALIVRWQWAGRPVPELERLATFCGALALIAIGTANVIWTAHLGLVSGDWEYYAFMGGILVSLLGALVTVWIAFPDILATKDDRQLTHTAR